MTSSPSFIYVITAGGAQKIGYARNPLQRLGALQLGAAHPLRLAVSVEVPANKARQVETKIHQLLNAAQIRGEWFDIAADAAMDALRRVLDGFDIPYRESVPPALKPKFGHLRLQLVVSKDFVARVDQWQRDQSTASSRSEAIRQLVELGLASTKPPESPKNRRRQPKL